MDGTFDMRTNALKHFKQKQLIAVEGAQMYLSDVAHASRMDEFSLGPPVANLNAAECAELGKTYAVCSSNVELDGESVSPGMLSNMTCRAVNHQSQSGAICSKNADSISDEMARNVFATQVILSDGAFLPNNVSVDASKLTPQWKDAMCIRSNDALLCSPHLPAEHAEATPDGICVAVTSLHAEQDPVHGLICMPSYDAESLMKASAAYNVLKFE